MDGINKKKTRVIEQKDTTLAVKENKIATDWPSKTSLYCLVAALIVILVGWFAFYHFYIWNDNKANVVPIVAIPSHEKAKDPCEGSWEMKALEKNTVNDNQFVDGVPEIKNAPITSGPTEEAKKAIEADLEKSKPHIGALENFGLSQIPNTWFKNNVIVIPELDLTMAKKNPVLIDLYRLRVDIVSIIKLNQVNAVTNVSSEDHIVCANSQTIQLAKDIEAINEMSDHQVTNITDPLNWINSGRKDGSDIIAPYSSPGNLGDTKAIVSTAPDGSKSGTLAHCGQQIKPKDHDRDNHTDRHHRDVCTRNCGHRLDKKDGNQDPNAKGNAPTYGGKNDNPGPGDKLPVTDPRAETRVNPGKPAVTTAPAGSKTDSSPTPAANPNAKTPSNPSSEVKKVPGL